MKVCTGCEVERDDFSPDKRRMDGLQSQCKACQNETLKEYHKTKIGLTTKMYCGQKHSSKRRNHLAPTYTNEELRHWLFSQKIFHELYDNWVANGYDKNLIPSCDRLDDDEIYSLDNLQIITWQENNQKGYDSRKKRSFAK